MICLFSFIRLSDLNCLSIFPWLKLANISKSNPKMVFQTRMHFTPLSICLVNIIDQQRVQLEKLFVNSNCVSERCDNNIPFSFTPLSWKHCSRYLYASSRAVNEPLHKNVALNFDKRFASTHLQISIYTRTKSADHLKHLRQLGAQVMKSRWRFFKKYFVRDEARFRLGEFVESRIVEKLLHPQNVTLRCSSIASGIVKPYFSENECGSSLRVQTTIQAVERLENKRYYWDRGATMQSQKILDHWVEVCR